MSFKLTILGSNSATPTSQRFTTAQLLNANERYFLIDCGEGTQIQLRRCSIKFGRINNIFISHLHGDHFYGLFGLLASFSLLGRKASINIYAHKDLEKIISPLLNYHANHISYQINFIALETGKNLIFEDKKMEVYSFPLKHRIKTWGFLFIEKEKEFNIKKTAIAKYELSIQEIVQIKKGSDLTLENGDVIPNSELTIPPAPPLSYAFCSDTAYYESVIEHIKGVDLLYHEATFSEEHKSRAKETGHSTAKQAATIAQKANVGKLLLGHYSGRHKDNSILLDEAKTIFENTELCEEGDVFEV